MNWNLSGSRIALALAGLLVLAPGCKTRPPTAKAEEQSAQPGINGEYLKPDLQVAEWVERFESEGREIYDNREKIVKLARVRPGTVVADVGAGTGLFTMLLAKEVGKKGKVYAGDIVPAFLRHIEKRAAAEKRNNVKTILGTEHSTQLPGNKFDLVFICDTYHHFEYPQSVLASIHRALKPGGEIFLVDFNRVQGQSSDWVLGHVRAGREVFEREIEQAGFQRVEQNNALKENYLLRFQKITK